MSQKCRSWHFEDVKSQQNGFLPLSIQDSEQEDLSQNTVLSWSTERTSLNNILKSCYNLKCNRDSQYNITFKKIPQLTIKLILCKSRRTLPSLPFSNTQIQSSSNFTGRKKTKSYCTQPYTYERLPLHPSPLPREDCLTTILQYKGLPNCFS